MFDAESFYWFAGLSCVLGGLGLLLALAVMFVDTSGQ